jgi:D-alanyl-D-alanine carboxypeptidase (penicillin-binding protein 5/6)
MIRSARRLRPLLLLACLLPLSARAATRFVDPPWTFPPPPKLPRVRAYILVDAATGTIVAERDAHRRLPPASLTKLMTAWIVYGALHRGTLRWHENVPVSVAAWRTGGSRMFVQPGLAVNVDQLMHGLLIDSGNDAAVALAQAVAGRRAAFVRMMNLEARRLGLRGTHYTDVDGLPAPRLYTTAYDVALLSLDLLRRDPSILRITDEKSYRYNRITQASWNPLLFHDPWVDGFKTGHTEAAGYCMDETASHDGRRFIAVVMGGKDWRGAMKAADTLLHYGFLTTRTLTVAPSGATVGYVRLPRESPEEVAYGLLHPVRLTVPLGFSRERLSLVFRPLPSLKGKAARLVPGARLGTVSVVYRKRALALVPAVARTAAHPAGWATRLGRWFDRLTDSW